MNKKILIIDDDEEMCTELKEILSDDGFEVSVASNGTVGSRLMEDDYYGVVILDLKLPGISGIEILKMVRDRNLHQKVLVFSGKPMGEGLHMLPNIEWESTEIIMKMADAVLNKPVSGDILLSKVKELTGSF